MKVGKYSGREELSDWWRLTLTAEFKGENLCFSNKRVAQFFRILRKKLNIRKRVVSVGGSGLTFYKIGGRAR